jgi:hypothetical protein
MASQKKPSIYSDRSTIGSSDELDEYGVWVKSEPQDLSSVNPETQESPVPDMEEFPDFEIGVTDTGAGEIPGDENADTGPAEKFDNGSLDLPDLDAGMEDAGGFDDIGIPEEDAGEAASGEPGFTEVSMEDFLDNDPDFDEPDIDDAGLEEEPSPAPAAGTASPDLSTQLLMKIADELSSIRGELSNLKKEFSVIRGEAPAEDREGAQRGGFFDEEDDEKIALTGDELDNILNTADFTEEAGADATETAADDFPAGDTLSPVEDLSDADTLSPMEDLSDADTLSSAEAFPDAEPLPDTDLLSSTELLSDGEDIIGGEPEIPAPEPAPAESGDAENFNIDLEIEQTDLVELGGESNVEESAALNDDLSFDSGEFDISLDDTSPDEAVEPAAETVETKDHEELKQLRETGAEPMTPAPEDISYLEEDPLAAEQEISLDETPDESLDEISLDDTAFDESSLDLSDAVIDEPDLGNQITENPLQEPSLDEISIDLDLDGDEGETVEEDLSPGTETEFGVEEIPEPKEEAPEEENFAQVIPEGFVVEAEDSQVPFEDDIEEKAFTEGEFTAEPEAAGTGGTAEETAPGEDEQDILAGDSSIPGNIRQELKTVLSYMDQLLESLPEEKIEEFAKSEYFDTYKKLFKELGLV